jgi:hypothetical protein
MTFKTPEFDEACKELLNDQIRRIIKSKLNLEKSEIIRKSSNPINPEIIRWHLRNSIDQLKKERS